MKNAASFAARILTAIAIAAVVAFAQYWIWQQLNRSTEFIGTNQSIKGFAYNGFQRDQSPLKGTYPTRAELASDLDLLGRYSDGLRTYGVNDLPELLDLAGERDMLVTAGAWIDARPDSNAREVAALIDAARKMRHIERVMVGNEAILRGDVTVGELIVYLDEVRKAIRKPVSTAEPWHVWLRYPELAKHVDYITVHLLPYHEGLPVDKAVEYAFQRYDEVARAHPRKKIVVGEVGWPSRGPTIDAAIPSLDNQARFVREFLAHPRTARIDYFLMEAIDQPWKVDVEGWAGPYWGMFNADREPKYQLEGVVERDPHWSHKASNAAALAFIPMMLAAFFLPGWSIGGRLFLAALIQACISTLIIGINVPVEYYLTQRDLIGLVLLIGATCMTAAVLLSHGFEFGEVLFKKKWARRFTPLPPHPPEQQPFVSIHLACYNEPPEMVIATIDSLAEMNYQNFEVLILDNNTRDEALWKPLERRCAELGPRFRFFHLANWPGFKAGALNYGLKVTDPRAEVVGV
ncbi:MAG: glycosyltransferase, partial [Thauera sp.]|nr:glycosyltransferase [Thauera sp.]